MSTVVWYLVFSFWSNGGVATIPQASREACLANSQWLTSEHHGDWGNVNVACIPGTAIQGVVH